MGKNLDCQRYAGVLSLSYRVLVIYWLSVMAMPQSTFALMNFHGPFHYYGPFHSSTTKATTETTTREKSWRRCSTRISTEPTVSANLVVDRELESVKENGKKTNAEKETANSFASDDDILKEPDTSSRWERRFQELVAFKRRHGHVHVPQQPTRNIQEDNKELATFCRNCRMHYRYYTEPARGRRSNLTEHRIRRLEALGFCWNRHDAAWELNYSELVDFKKRFGHCNVPVKWEENLSLANWVVMQRQKYRKQVVETETDNETKPGTASSSMHISMVDDQDEETRLKAGGKDYRGKILTAEQISKLQSLGFHWNPNDEIWWRMYKDLQQFHRSHGHFRVPVNYEQNPKLNRWLSIQRRFLRECEPALETVNGQRTINGHDSFENDNNDDVSSRARSRERMDALQALGLTGHADIQNATTVDSNS